MSKRAPVEDLRRIPEDVHIAIAKACGLAALYGIRMNVTLSLERPTKKKPVRR